MINESMNKEIAEIKDALSVLKLWLDDSDYKGIVDKVNSEYSNFRLTQIKNELNKTLAE